MWFSGVSWSRARVTFVTKKFAYGLVNGNSGPHWRLRPAIGYGAYGVLHGPWVSGIVQNSQKIRKIKWKICEVLLLTKFRPAAYVLGRPIISQTALACQVVKMHKNNAKSSAFCTKTWRFPLFLCNFYNFWGISAPFLAILPFLCAL